ncbi:MAG TPA: hypothetical protein VK982_03570 [Bacteroidales bacterium]|nr:hypothetical protein [Bacteroidales bacterium]
MVKKYLIFFIVFLSIHGFLYAQKIANKQFSLIQYNLELSKEIRSELDELDNFISKIKTYNDLGNDKLKAILVHTIFFTFKEVIERDIELEVLPINTFMNAVKYDDYGYPKTNIRKALRKGYSQYYFKLDVYIESIDIQQKKDHPKKYEDITYKTTYPQVTINMTIYSKDGIIPVYNLIGNATASNPLQVNKYLLKGFDNTEMEIAEAGEHQSDNLYTVFYRATKNLIQDYYNK